jgi:ABC-type Mn2+/Zn2+ transport system permease subunit
MNPKEAEAQGISVRLWDFLFYASFGLVVTSRPKFIRAKLRIPVAMLVSAQFGLQLLPTPP